MPGVPRWPAPSAIGRPSNAASNSVRRCGTAEQEPMARRAAAILPSASVSMTPATMTIEITRYLRAPSLRKWLRAALRGFGTRIAVTISSGRHCVWR